MQRVIFSTGTIVLVVMAVFVWSRTALVSVQAGKVISISPTDTMRT